MSIISVGCILFNDKNEILLQKRDEKQTIYFPGKWGLFGGSCEDKENPEKAVEREIFEELNIKVSNLEEILTLKINCSIFEGSIRTRIFYSSYLDSVRKKEIILKEGSGFSFFSFKELPPVCETVSFDLSAISIFGLTTYHEQIVPTKIC
jgi:8-oxo-dGTP pyrophosphatase MutT (NUDIX family)